MTVTVVVIVIVIGFVILIVLVIVYIYWDPRKVSSDASTRPLVPCSVIARTRAFRRNLE